MARTTWTKVAAARKQNSAVEAAYLAAQRAFELGVVVRAMREDRGWSQRELAELTDLTQPAIARFEAGGTTPTLAMLERFAAAFDLTLVVDFQPSA